MLPLYLYVNQKSDYDMIWYIFSHYKSMGANDPEGMATLDSRVFIGRIYVGDH